MLKENLIMLRKINRFSQEQIAERIHISRQAYAKWESGATVPDIEKCAMLASVYGVTVDSLINSQTQDDVGILPPAPEGKNIWGSVTINDRGQIVIPKNAREKLGIDAGTRLIVLSDSDGIALVPTERFEKNIRKILEFASL